MAIMVKIVLNFLDPFIIFKTEKNSILREPVAQVNKMRPEKNQKKIET